MNIKAHLEAERHLIRALLSPSWVEYIQMTKPEYFYSSQYREIIQRMRDSKTTINSEWLLAFYCENKWDVSGWLEIENSVAVNAHSWLVNVKDNYVQRELAKITALQSKEVQGIDQLFIAKSEIERIESEVTENGHGNPHQEFVESLSPDKVLYKTFFPTVDRFLCGFERGDYVLIAARPSVGKTAIGCTMFYQMAKFGHYSVDYHSYEMMRDRIRRRVVSNVGGIDIRKMKNATLTAVEYQDACACSEKLESYPMRFVNSSGVNIENLCVDIRMSKADIVFVDYLGCIPSTVEGNKTQQIGQVSNELRSTAKRSGKVVIALVQLSRDSVKQDREPDLSDLRDSGELEQDADAVCFLYDPQSKYNFENNVQDIEVSLLFKKMRDGEIGRKNLRFNKPFSRFYDPTDMVEPEPHF